MSLENSIDSIGNRTRHLPACSVVPQPTAPPRIPFIKRRTTHKTSILQQKQKQIFKKLSFLFQMNYTGYQNKFYAI
jgi:hypothetical protein